MQAPGFQAEGGGRASNRIAGLLNKQVAEVLKQTRIQKELLDVTKENGKPAVVEM